MRISDWSSDVCSSDLLNGFVAALACLVASPAAVLAAQPAEWQLGFQPAATPIMEQVDSFHDLLLVIITLICVLVLVLMGYTMWRVSAERKPVTSRTTHQTHIGVPWTEVPGGNLV